AINRFQYGIEILTNGGNTIAGNFIGTDTTGTTALGNSDGIAIVTPNNTIGGTTAADRNLISGSVGSGIDVRPRSATPVPSGTVIQGNFIGTNAAGTQALPNQEGIHITGA